MYPENTDAISSLRNPTPDELREAADDDMVAATGPLIAALKAALERLERDANMESTRTRAEAALQALEGVVL